MRWITKYTAAFAFVAILLSIVFLSPPTTVIVFLNRTTLPYTVYESTLKPTSSHGTFCYTNTAKKCFDQNLTIRYDQDLHLMRQPEYMNALPAKIDPVFVTGCSSNHFGEVLKNIGTMQKYFPHSKIIFVDLGINDKERKKIQKLCQVQLRKFNFTQYPPYFKKLSEYRWKPVIIMKFLQEFESIWWSDSSIKWHSSNLSYIYDQIAAKTLSSYTLVDPTGHSIFAATNPGMYSYLPESKTDGYKEAKMHGGGFVLAVRSPDTWDTLRWLVMCALEPQCMAPKGAQLYCNFAKGDRMKKYAKCHRYDQSAINILLANKNDYDTSKYVRNGFAKVARSSQGGVPPKTC